MHNEYKIWNCKVTTRVKSSNISRWNVITLLKCRAYRVHVPAYLWKQDSLAINAKYIKNHDWICDPVCKGKHCQRPEPCHHSLHPTDWSFWQSKAQGLQSFFVQFERRRGSPWLGNESLAEGIVERGEASYLRQPGWVWAGAGGCLLRLHVGPRRHLGSCYHRSWVCFLYEAQQTGCQPWSSFPVSKKCVITPTSRRFTYIILQPATASCCFLVLQEL